SPACRDAAHRALAERAPALVARLGPAFAPAANAPGLHATGSAFLPLVVGGKAMGVLHVHRRSSPFEADDLRVMVALAAQLALTAQNLDLMQDLQAFYLGTMGTLADAVEARDATTGGHCKRVSDLSVRLAQAAGLPEPEVEEIRVGALVHDIGKIGIRDQILGKPGGLTTEEMEHVRQHTVIGERIIAQLPVSQTMRDVILHHHERYNGAGYPHGLRGEAILMSARENGILTSPGCRRWPNTGSRHAAGISWDGDAARQECHQALLGGAASGTCRRRSWGRPEKLRSPFWWWTTTWKCAGS
ncbi:MAG: HD-GYP domain-containing protein, partial [Gemmatimonadales bacterium]